MPKAPPDFDEVCLSIKLCVGQVTRGVGILALFQQAKSARVNPRQSVDRFRQLPYFCKLRAHDRMSHFAGTNRHFNERVAESTKVPRRVTYLVTLVRRSSRARHSSRTTSATARGSHAPQSSPSNLLAKRLLCPLFARTEKAGLIALRAASCLSSARDAADDRVNEFSSSTLFHDPLNANKGPPPTKRKWNWHGRAHRLQTCTYHCQSRMDHIYVNVLDGNILCAPLFPQHLYSTPMLAKPRLSSSTLSATTGFIQPVPRIPFGEAEDARFLKWLLDGLGEAVLQPNKTY